MHLVNYLIVIYIFINNKTSNYRYYKITYNSVKEFFYYLIKREVEAVVKKINYTSLLLKLRKLLKVKMILQLLIVIETKINRIQVLLHRRCAIFF